MQKRTLADWAAIAEIIGGIAVVVSLLFLIYTINQNTEALQAATWESFLDRSESVNLAVAQSSELARIIQLGELDPAQLDSTEYSRFSHFARMRFGAWEAVFAHYKVGRLGQDDWVVWNAFYSDLMDHPGYRQVWLEIERWYDPDFRATLRKEYLGDSAN